MMTATKRKTDNATEPSTVFARQRTPNAKIEQYERWLNVLRRKLKSRSSFEFIYKGGYLGGALGTSALATVIDSVRMP
jgi:hypothetical protein